uniref:ATP-dependent Clp protease ATP-binding subunit clpC n=1 Tax=Aegilops tauschii TaxID=37682 RepID=R7WE59_AEGTA
MVPDVLAGARVIELDVGALVAGTKWRGSFERRMKDVIKQVEAADGKVILFIDEMHMLLGAGRSRRSAMDAANMLKPALARGRIRCVGATTFDEYRKYIEKDAALKRRFQKVQVEEPSMDTTIEILQALKKRHEHHHGLEIQDAALVAAAQLAGRYITAIYMKVVLYNLRERIITLEHPCCIGYINALISGRQFPDKAIDLIDEACATASKKMRQINRKKAEVNTTKSSSAKAMKEAIIIPDDVGQVVSRWTGIPVTALNQEEKDKLICLADRLHQRVVGQDEAVNLVADAVLRSRVGLDHPGQPIGSFLFLGSTGVGKTELAKALAEQLFDSEKMLVRFDMSEYVGSSSVLRLVGAPPSYRGHEDGGQLTEKVRRNPYSVILFDEVEKADPSVFNIFLQILDDSRLTDGRGQTVDFKNTIIIMTSNLGSDYLISKTARENTTISTQELLMEQVCKHFKPELLNRLSEIVIFEPLSHDKLKEIMKIQMKSIMARVATKGISLSVSDAALDTILSESYTPTYGARPIRRWMQKNVMTTLSKMLVKGEAGEGSTICIEATDDNKGLKYEVVKEFPWNFEPKRTLGHNQGFIVLAN